MTRPPDAGRRRRSDDFRNARWYVLRPASNRKPATYRCPLCNGRLPAMSPHTLVLPEGDGSRRRHAHTGCVVNARRAGRLPLREEVEPRRPGLLARLLRHK
jgi:hypothetical protein